MSRPRRYVRRPAAGTTGGGVEGIPAGAGSTSAVAPGVGGAGVDRKCGRPGGALGVSTATCVHGPSGSSESGLYKALETCGSDVVAVDLMTPLCWGISLEDNTENLILRSTLAMRLRVVPAALMWTHWARTSAVSIRGAPCGWKWTARSDRRVLCTTSGLQACSTSLSKSDGDAPALLHSHMNSCTAAGPTGRACFNRPSQTRPLL